MAISDIPGDIEQTKRRHGAASAAGIPPGIALTPEQQKTQADAEWLRSSQQRQAGFKQGVSDVAGSVGGKIKDAYGVVLGAATVIPRTGYGIATGEIPVNVQHLPDYSTPATRAARAGATPGQQAGAIEAYDIAQRAVGAAQRPFTAGIAGNLLTVNKPSKPHGGATGVSPARQDAEQVAASVQSERGGGAGGADDQGNGWSQTGINGIAGRMGANGVPEFSNAQSAVQGAGPKRAIGRVGDGIGGGISYGEAGDSAMAIDRFERANAERAKMVDISRRGGIGENGGLTIVGSGQMTMDEIAREKLGLRSRAVGVQEAEQRRLGIDAGLDRNLRERELAGAEQRNVLEAQRTQQEIEAGNLTLAQQRQVADLYAKYEQAKPDERAAIGEQIRTLTGKDAANRFTVVPGGQEYDGKAMALVNRPARVLNNQTGQFVDGAGNGSSSSDTTAPQRVGTSPDGKAVYQDANGNLFVDA